jgi:hypothetical protein
LHLSRKDLAYLNDLKEFPDLEPLVDYFRRSLRFSLWQRERLLAYYRTWDMAELQHDYEALPVTDETKETLARLENAVDADARWKIADYEWQNIGNGLYRAQEGEAPAEVWERFLRDKGINESIEYEDGHD